MRNKALRTLSLNLGFLLMVTPSFAGQFSVSDVMDEVVEQRTERRELQEPWWTTATKRPIARDAEVVATTLSELLDMALRHSAKLSVASHVPMIRETAVTETAAAFDPTAFANSVWDDTSEPVGSSLTVGGTGRRFRDHNLSVDVGRRRRLQSGGTVEMYQRLGHQNNNSTFFTPNNQGTTRLVLGYTQPLLRGRGRVYNTSLTVLAQIDVATSRDELNRQINAHLYEVVRAYWSLYLERATLVQKVQLYLRTKDIVGQLEGRQAVDAKKTQLISATAALESRRSDLIRARAAVKNAETRLRTLINAPEWMGDASHLEIIPAEHPSVADFQTDLAFEFETAIASRPEVAVALKEIRAASIRLDMARHEVLPMLNLVTETYVAGLRGNSRIGDAWVDQFREGEPSYSIGLQFEVPLCRRAACARQTKRQLEVRKLQEEYRSTLELIRGEVEVAVREVNTAYQELWAKERARHAAKAEAETLEVRWTQLANRNGTSGLLLESLLRAQERVTDAESEFATAQLTYNLALINMRHANGTLMQVLPATMGDSDISYEAEPVAPPAATLGEIELAPVSPPEPRLGRLPPAPPSFMR